MVDTLTTRRGSRGKTLAAAFSLGFVLYLLCVLPIIVHHGGMFFYYGDYNVQQVPFYILAHRAVRNGEFLWNWNLDLGGSMIGDFAFYLWGSPFFWMTIPFPESAIPYLMPFLMALKFGLAMATVTLYFRRYVKEPLPLLTGALLYAFSGFQACNIVFQHFADVTAFFPLLLYAFDELMFADHRRGEQPFVPSGKKLIRFALTCALMSVVNYYFFYGQIVFLLLYFVIRYAMHNPARVTARMFLRALAGGALGVMIAGIFLVQAYFGVTGNARIADVLTGYNLLVYESMKLPYAIVKSFAMINDIIGKGTLFYTDAIRNSSLAGYLPLFGVSGVAAFLFSKKRQEDWRKTLFIVCAVIAFVPFFNAAFSLFNNEYYARWFYMPMLFMAMVTAIQLESGNGADWKLGTVVSAILFLFMLTVALLPSKDADGVLVYLNMVDNPDLFWRQVKGTGVMVMMLVVLIYFVRGRKIRQIATFAATIAACFISTYVLIYNGASLINDFGMEEWKFQMLDSKPELEGESFFRIETDSTSTNYEMAWGIPSIHCFLSTVPSGIFDFYEGTADIYRGVESDTPINRAGIRAVLSAKYYLENAVVNSEGEFGANRGTPGYVYVEDQNDFAVYENENYIPMGFTFDYYIRKSVFDTVNKTDADRSLVRAVILDDADADRFCSCMEELPRNMITEVLPDEVFADYCRERRKSACTAFLPDTNGFSATTADLLHDNLVFFSVPLTRGFSATVDGEPAELVEADYGLIAIPVPAGVHEIRVDYRSEGAKQGLAISILGILLTVLYGLFAGRFAVAAKVAAEQDGSDEQKDQEEQEEQAEAPGDSGENERNDLPGSMQNE